MKLSANLAFHGLFVGSCAVSAFTAPSRTVAFRNSALNGVGLKTDDLADAVERSTDYVAGSADTKFAKAFGSQAGKKRKTVGEAFASFTNILGGPINALYKNMMSDLVGTTHLTVTDARFVRDPVWSLGMITALEVLLKNYPEEYFAKEMITSLIQSIEFDEAVLRAEAESVITWCEGKSAADVEAALKGEGDGPIFDTGEMVRNNEFFKYSKFFGIGLSRIMSEVGVDDGDNYSTTEEWIGKILGKPYYTACNDSDTWNKMKGRLEMMETMMKEIEIREKKKMAQRLEERAEMTLLKAQNEAEWQKELEKDKSSSEDVEKKEE